MIKQLKITNFRCYQETIIDFNGTSILVGKNNAGKSSLIEAQISMAREYTVIKQHSGVCCFSISGAYCSDGSLLKKLNILVKIADSYF